MSSYWEKRFLDLWLFNEAKDKRYLRQMDKRFVSIRDSVSDSIDTFLKRWANQDKLDLDELRLLISKSDQQSWKFTLQEFRQKAIDGGYDDELNREYFRSRISRLDALKSELYIQLAEAANQEDKSLSSHLKDQFKETLYQTIYKLTDNGAFTLPINWGKYNADKLKIILSTPWEGSNFSSRVWGNLADKLPDKLTQILSQGAVNGWGIDRIKKEMMTGFDSVAANRMYTLVQTESAHIAEMASMAGYRETNVEQWQWMATLETHTCKYCASMDSEVFEVDGNQDPPPGGSHPNCRCRSLPYIDGWVHLKRWSRNPETGKGERIDFVSYDDWLKGQHYQANNAIIGMKTVDGIEIKRTSQHLAERTIGRSVSPSEIKDALQNPIYIRPDKIDSNGVSRKYVGLNVSVVVNPETGTVITTHKTGSRTVRKYTKEG